MAEITIALDAMGGDHGTRTVVPAVLQILKARHDIRLILVGESYILNKQLKLHKIKESDRVWIHHASEKVGMDESPLLALRHKKDSSMRVALNLVKQGTADACVSAGNTGALLAIARFVLKTLPGIDRPAIVRVLPTLNPARNVRVLDLGANVDSSAEHLLQFAVMGATMASAIDNVVNPAVSLLNIGVEDIKGNELVKQAAQLLRANSAIHFNGYIEGDMIFKGMTDVIVCDGFVGNIALKVMEGSLKQVTRLLSDAFKKNWLTRLAGLAAMRVLMSLRKQVNSDRYNGASLLGLQGIVIKSHGGASAEAFAYAIEAAINEVEHDVPARISKQVSHLLRKSNIL